MIPEVKPDHYPSTREGVLKFLAAIEHQRWARWQEYLQNKCLLNPDGSLTIPKELVERWERQIYTHYDDLSDTEKASDDKEVMNYWPHVESFFERYS